MYIYIYTYIHTYIYIIICIICILHKPLYTFHTVMKSRIF